MKRFLLVTLLTVFYCALPVSAHTLRALVVEVHDGKTITVENSGRRLKVALKAAEAPERDQPYGEVARQHLSRFVLNREVALEYTGLGASALLIARVMVEDRDIGLQMIRDGVAWFDRNYEGELGPAERRVYADSETAARNEHRGIWKDPSPIPPWEWRQANADKSNGKMIVSPSYAGKSTGNHMAASAETPATPAKRTVKNSSVKWPVFSPTGNLFSIRIPGGGRAFSAEVNVPKGRPVNANFYWVHHLKIGYLAVWASGPHEHETVSALFDRSVEALNEAAAARGLSCEFYQVRDAPMGGYIGRQYKVRGCYLNGVMRNYYKVEGKTLKVIFVGVMSEIPNDPSVNEFLDSFVIN